LESSALETVSLARLALTHPRGLAGLEPLFEETHGGGARNPGWLPIKLKRECVDLNASCVVRTVATDASEPMWLGFALVGTPPSLAPCARMSGMGVVPLYRGRGLARRMLAHIQCTLPATHYELRCLSEPRNRNMYTHLGFRESHNIATLLHFGAGSDTALRDPNDASPGSGEVISQWLDETWTHSPAASKQVWETDDGRAYLTQEGCSLLVHRFELANTSEIERGALVLDGLRLSVKQGTPVLVYGWPDDPDALRSVDLRGWQVAQRACVMVRDY
jgi:GNAT superfamily N-acetyltransferase